MREAVIQAVLEHKIVAIARGMAENEILPLAEALYRGGIRMMEITFRQAKPESFADTARGIAALAREMAGRMLVGAGTVLTPEQAELAAGSGALYIVSPDTNVDVIRRTRGLGLVSMPGATTPSEAMTAHLAGADFIKLFPAGDLGPGYLKAIRAPLSHLKFLAVGGINESNAAAFMKAGAVGLGVGGNLANKAWIEAGDFEKITATAAAMAQAVKG